MEIKRIRIIKNEKGASAVEFALILPILIMLVFGIFQFGIAYNNYITITHAAREGARRAAVDLDISNLSPLKQIIIDRAYPIPLTEADIDIRTPEGIKIGDPVEVEITYNITVEIPLVGSWSIPLTSKAVMRLENYEY
ncbi:MAG: TadE family protein [Candidatus Humimicrobiia bacterium]